MFDVSKIPVDQFHEEETNKNEALWTTNNVHDPLIYNDNGTYYAFSTDAQVDGKFKAGIQIRESKDLMNWKWVGRAFPDVPQQAKEWTGATGLWAPDVVKFGEKYHLYYSASQFGKNQSFIGLATSENILGPWVDQGEVVKTRQGDLPNAIDSNISFDENGVPWMVYGSFFGGIFIAEINPDTGKFVNPGYGKLIARRNESVEKAIEGPYIIYNPDVKYYYLFSSFDSLFNNYNIRVARSKNIDGPYVDIAGNEMTNTSLAPYKVGMKVLGGYKFSQGHGWIAPGHNSVLKEGNDYFVVHHARTAASKGHYLHVRKIVWTNDGWPLVSPERYAGEKEITIDLNDLFGQWEFVRFDSKNNDQIHSKTYKLIESKSEDSNSFQIEKIFDESFIISNIDESYLGKVIHSWDWELSCQTYVYMGKDEHGHVLVGKKIYKI